MRTVKIIAGSVGALVAGERRELEMKILEWVLAVVLALILLAPATAPYWLLPYLALLGLTSGLAFTGFTALWAELYGTAHLGAIRSTAGAISVFASALGPLLAGVLLDFGMAMETIGLGFAGYGLIATVLLIQALRPSGARLADGFSKHPG